ncbi:MAG TPA: hypothetical protein VFY73_07660 [Ideonella sp.]|uniref:hypothetical protein n=1 Tax=Ideonella sp. TaxID=1929293 RepID=UPI002E34204A|nr:hypothetical protein [Ideonella sp.]HEX5683896.1 hypothetical protein [Ideonella sp.]
MCAASTPADDNVGDLGHVVLEGRVEKRALGQGTKSAHHGMVLVLADGSWHVLRRAGGHAYVDPAFEAMEGQRVRLRGKLRPNFFLVESADEPND